MNWTIGNKLTFGFGFIVTLFAVSGALTFVRIQAIDGHLKKITEVKEPANAAAFEMEINLLGTGFALLGYLNDRDPLHLKRIEKDQLDFKAFQTIYYELSRTEKEKALGVEIGQGYSQFKGLAAEIIRIDDEQVRKMELLLRNLDEMDTTLDEKMQVSIQREAPNAYEKLQAVLDLEINVNGIAKGV